jgi:hypothetical protein
VKVGQVQLQVKQFYQTGEARLADWDMLKEAE